MTLFSVLLSRIIPIIFGWYQFIYFKCWMAALILAILAEPTQAAIKKKGPYHDPANYVAGWTSAAYTKLGDGGNCILFLYGHATSGDPNNSIRCFDSATGEITYVQPDTEDEKKHINGDGLNDRDNHLSLSIPGRGLLITGGAYLNGKEYVNGFFNYKTLRWDYRNDIYSLFIKPEGFNWSTFNPAMAWSKKLNTGFVYGGYVNGSPSTFITLIHPKDDGTFALEPLKGIPGTQSCMNMRNSAVAVGEWVYVIGGKCLNNSGIGDTAWFRRFNLVSHQWEQLADLPVVRLFPQVTYDKQTGDIVVYGGNGADSDGNNYWTGRNNVHTWSVDTQGPWIDRTSEANMPAVRMPFGAYDPTTGEHCYRGGTYFDDNGKQNPGTLKGNTIWCLKLGTPALTPPATLSSKLAKKSLPSSDSAHTKPPKPHVTHSSNKDFSSAPPNSAHAKLLPKPIASSSRRAVGSIDRRIQSLQEKLEGLLLRYTEKHPSVIAIKDTLAMLQEQKRLGVKHDQEPQQYQSPNRRDFQPNSGGGIKTAVNRTAMDLKVDSSAIGHRATVVEGIIYVNTLSRMLPPIKTGLSPRNSAKHMRMTELDNGRLYIVAGDWGAADGYPQDGRQDIHSYDIFTDTWTLESPYCGKEGKYPFHPDEIGQMWDTKRKVMWLGPGIIYPYTDNCNQGGGLRVPLTYFNPQTREWNRSPTAQVPPEFSKTPRPPAHGLYDAKTDSLIFLNDTHTYYYDLDVESWSSFPRKNGRFADGTLARVGRWIYIIDEAPYTLYRWNIDTHAFELVADLPADIRNGDGDDHGRVYLSALGKKIALYQGNHWGQLHPPKNLVVHSKAYIFDTDTNQFQEITWDNPEQVEGNTMTWHSSGWMVLFGCADSDGCNGKTKVMDHIYLVDLRQFGGTGESLSKD